MGCGASTDVPIAYRAPSTDFEARPPRVEATDLTKQPEQAPAASPVFVARQGSHKKEKQSEQAPAASPVSVARQASGKRAKEPRKERAKGKDEDNEQPVDTSALLALQEASGVLAAMQRSDALVVAAEGRWQQQQMQNEASRARYVEAQAVFDALESGDVAVVSLRWLLAHAASGRPLPRRQDMPKEAHVSAYTLQLWHNAAPDHVRKAVLPLISVSYCWLSPEQ